MKITWDEQKRKRTLAERGLDFSETKKVFEGAIFTFEDDRFDYEERRYVTLGLLGGDVIVIVHTETEKEIRVISMRKGDKDEQKTYFENV